jgi:hypothetical protein
MFETTERKGLIDRLLPWQWSKVSIPENFKELMHDLDVAVSECHGKELEDPAYDVLTTKMVQVLGAIQKERYRNEIKAKATRHESCR